MINLNPKEISEAKLFIKALFYEAGQSGLHVANNFYKSDCTPICEELVNRQCEFIKNKLDYHLDNLSQQKYRGPGGGVIKRSAAQLAKYIAWFCDSAELIWDDSIITTYELDAIKQTLLGKTLFDAGCFASSPIAAAQPASTTTRTSTPKAPGQPPVNGYKASGGHSNEIPNLIGTPGVKKFSLGGVMFCIEADKIGKNTPCAFITPIKAGTSNVILVSKADAEKVNFGSGNGYTDCALWFDNQTDANSALTYCQNNPAFSKYSNFHIAQAKADQNGYFEVTTALGNAYIKAKKLNEDLEALYKQPVYENASKNFEITDIELYDEWMHKSIS